MNPKDDTLVSHVPLMGSRSSSFWGCWNFPRRVSPSPQLSQMFERTRWAKRCERSGCRMRKTSQLGSSGIRGQSSAYCLIDLMSNYMGGCVKIGHPKFHGFNVGTRLVGWYSIVAIFFSPYSVPWCLVGASIVASCFQIFLKVFFHFFLIHILFVYYFSYFLNLLLK